MQQVNTPLSLRLDPVVRDRLQHEAQLEDRSLSYIAQKAIVSFLDARDQKRNAIQAALVEADKGVFISDEAMNVWVDSWDSDGELALPVPDIFS